MSARRTEMERLAAAYRHSVAILTGRAGPSVKAGRLRRFVVQVDVSQEFLRAAPDIARAEANRMLDDQTNRGFYGPRGGRYVAAGAPFDLRENEQFGYGIVNFKAIALGRYVRPRPRKTTPSA